MSDGVKKTRAKVSWSQIDPAGAVVGEIIGKIVEEGRARATPKSELDAAATSLQKGYEEQRRDVSSRALPPAVERLLVGERQSASLSKPAQYLLEQILVVATTSSQTTPGRSEASVTNDEVTRIVQLIQRHVLTIDDLKVVLDRLETTVAGSAKTEADKRAVGGAQQLTRMLRDQLRANVEHSADGWECRLMPSDQRAFALDSVVVDPQSHGFGKLVSQQMQVDGSELFVAGRCGKPAPAVRSRGAQAARTELSKVNAEDSVIVGTAELRKVYSAFNLAMLRANLPAKQQPLAWHALRRVMVDDEPMRREGFAINDATATFDNPAKPDQQAMLAVVKAMVDLKRGETILGDERDGTYFGIWNRRTQSVLGDTVDASLLVGLSERDGEGTPVDSPVEAGSIWPGASVQEGRLTHKVSPDQSWTDVAAVYSSFGVTAKELRQANDSTDSRPPVGEQITVPVVLVGPTNYPVLTLESSQTVAAIARRLGALNVSAKQLAAANQVRPTARLRKGRRLVVPVALAVN